MDEDEITRRLGLPPGPTMTRLVALAERVAPKHPSAAFDSLWLSMSWLEHGQRGGQRTPRNVHPFAETGGDMNHFGFLMDHDRPTEERPIVYVVPKDEDAATEIVAPNLREFLGLIAIAFGEVVSRGATDEQWFDFRNEWYGEEPERLEEMARLSDLLCTIPGVIRPSHPSRIAAAHPNQPFVLDSQEALAQRPFLPKEERLSNILIKGAGLGGLVSAILYWRGFAAWATIGVPIGAAWYLIRNLGSRDQLYVGQEGLTCRRGRREWRIAYEDIFRIYKFQEQWIFESKPSHRRFTFHLRGHDHHLEELALAIEGRAATLRLGWLESIAKISRLLR